ncbi:MAG: Alpha-mann-mid domain-containing protein [Xylanivirga thermophila]|uniref:glycoside hydrolase family 38 N-terminal domain-containing protein n=1 Tax=Xylanivirga thermophila TaxID=2496273 RepID=UPI0039F578A6
MEKMHLICNAHIDPMWQWEWEEGIGAVLSTFRVAAELCEKNDTFIFNHNEAMIYQWIEEYEPKLFERIKLLVKAGKWHIMGGWYLQPDCNMLNGESFIRQSLYGIEYFKEKFGVRPTTAVNFDSFGHTKGLVQILGKCGYDSYLITRPNNEIFPTEDFAFIWEGFAGSEVIVARAESYNSALGQATKKIQQQMEKFKNSDIGFVLWGVGNHGGGPSRKDLKDISLMIKQDDRICHSTPEQYIRDVNLAKDKIEHIDRSIWPFSVGCYTTQILIKQKHRQLENQLIYAEKMASQVAGQDLSDYPSDKLYEAAKDLMLAQFHDILAGTTIQVVEQQAIELLDHGLEETRRIKAKAFFKLCQGQIQAKEGEIPIMVYNPHPYPVKTIVECEFMLADQNHELSFTQPTVFSGGQKLKSQCEKEDSNIPLDWRKRVAFLADLEPMCINRFDIRLERLKEKPSTSLSLEGQEYVLQNDRLSIKINADTGQIEEMTADGFSCLQEGIKLAVYDDNEDPWGMNVNAFDKYLGEFTLLSAEEAAKFSKIKAKNMCPVRIIEDGEVRTVIETLLGYGDSRACVRYYFDKTSNQIGIKIKTYFMEKNKMLKLKIPTTMKHTKFLGKTAFGINNLETNGHEATAQEYVILTDGSRAFSCINTGNYGFSSTGSDLEVSLIRTAAYCAHPYEEREILPQDRFTPRIDQGERNFEFYISCSELNERMSDIEFESALIHQAPMAVSFFPSGEGNIPEILCDLDNKSVQLVAVKKAETGDGYVFRLYNSLKNEQKFRLQIPMLRSEICDTLMGYEFKTYLISDGIVQEINAVEELL